MAPTRKGKASKQTSKQTSKVPELEAPVLQTGPRKRRSSIMLRNTTAECEDESEADIPSTL